MFRFALHIFIISSLLTGSCTSRKNKLDQSNLIPEEQLRSIISDAYIADGLLAIPVVNHWIKYRDSLSVYIQIIEKYGYSKETMDKTMKYYFIKKPKKLINIYDQVLGTLSQMESILELESLKEEGRIRNIWHGNEFYSFPDISGSDSAGFSVSLPDYGTYTLNFSATVFPDDQALNPRLTAYLVNADSLETGKRNYIEMIKYPKDGQTCFYSLRIEVATDTKLYLRGNFYNYDNSVECEKHAMIENISLYFIPSLL